MDDLFKHPLWMMWKYAYPKEEDKIRQDVREEAEFEDEKFKAVREGSVTSKGGVYTKERAED